MTDFSPTDRNRVRRLPARASYDAETIYPIIDEALICHVGFVADGQPFVIPTIHARMGDTQFAAPRLPVPPHHPRAHGRHNCPARGQSQPST